MAGNVTDVRALGIPEAREALGFEFPPLAAPETVNIEGLGYIDVPQE